MLDAIIKAHDEIKKMVAFIKECAGRDRQTEIPHSNLMEVDHDMFEEIKAFAIDQVREALDTDDKTVRDARLAPIIDEIHAKFDEKYPEQEAVIDECDLQTAKICSTKMASG